jgi:hypothetical protein
MRFSSSQQAVVVFLIIRHGVFLLAAGRGRIFSHAICGVLTRSGRGRICNDTIHAVFFLNEPWSNFRSYANYLQDHIW